MRGTEHRRDYGVRIDLQSWHQLCDNILFSHIAVVKDYELMWEALEKVVVEDLQTIDEFSEPLRFNEVDNHALPIKRVFLDIYISKVNFEWWLEGKSIR